MTVLCWVGFAASHSGFGNQNPPSSAQLRVYYVTQTATAPASLSPVPAVVTIANHRGISSPILCSGLPTHLHLPGILRAQLRTC
jgi:hypothetical protein